jgi:hypothetical protein
MGTLKAVVPKNHLLLPSVQESIAQLDEADASKDAGLRRLAEVYAAAIDEALDVAIDARSLVADAMDEDNPLEIAKRLLNALVKYSDSNAVLEQLGPKLQAVLESLGASPKARSQMTGKGGGAPNVPAGGQTPFERRRAAAAAREQTARAHGSPAVDSSA